MEKRRNIPAYYPRRERLQVYGDILKAIRDEISEHGIAKLTRVHGRANVPYDRLQKYIGTLGENGLVECLEKNGHTALRITENGMEYLKHMEIAANFLKTFAKMND